MLTRFSGVLDLDSLTAEQVDLRDLAWSLTRQQRFNGHAHRPWTVAQHSILVERISKFLVGQPPACEMLFLDPGNDPGSPASLRGVTWFMDALHTETVFVTIWAGALLHDCHEAYIGDIVEPVGRKLNPALGKLKENVDAAVYGAFGLEPLHKWPSWHREVVRNADQIALRWEFETVCGQTPEAATELSGVFLDPKWKSLSSILASAYRPCTYNEFYRKLATLQAELFAITQGDCPEVTK